MLDQLKRDRVAQAMLAAVVLIGCLGCVVLVSAVPVLLAGGRPAPDQVVQDPASAEVTAIDTISPTLTASPPPLPQATPTNTPGPTATATATNTPVVLPTGTATPAIDVLGTIIAQYNPNAGAEIEPGSEALDPFAVPAPAGPTATPPGSEIGEADYLAGLAAYETENYPEVLTLMERVLQQNPDLAPPHWYRGMAYYYLGDYVAGLAEMEQAVALDPAYALAYADRGLIQAALGNIGQAVADWDRALALDPTLAKVFHYIAAQYYAGGDYDTALAAYTRALAIDPNRADSWQGRAETLRQLGEHQACINDADRALALAPELWPAFLTRGICLVGRGDVATASTDLALYLEVSPDNAEAWDYSGRAAYALGNYQEAIAAFDQAIGINPAPVTYYYRGIAYQASEQADAAISDLELFLEQAGSEDPDLAEDARARLAELQATAP